MLNSRAIVATVIFVVLYVFFVVFCFVVHIHYCTVTQTQKNQLYILVTTSCLYSELQVGLH